MVMDRMLPGVGVGDSGQAVLAVAEQEGGHGDEDQRPLECHCPMLECISS